MSKSVAQIFSPLKAYVPTKASLHFNVAGESSGPFVLSNTDTVIDSTNFSELTRGSASVEFRDDEDGQTGVGVIKLLASEMAAVLSNYNKTVTGGAAQGDLDGNGLVEFDDLLLAAQASSGGCQAYFPIQAEIDGKYSLWIRHKANTLHFSSTVTIDDGSSFSSISSPTGDWVWQEVEIDVKDTEIHTLKIEMLGVDFAVDKIVITRTGTIPTDEGPNYTPAPYVTAHVRLAAVLSNKPTTYYRTLSSHSTYDTIAKDGWYNFDLTRFIISDWTNSLAVVLKCTGTSASHYLIWSLADNVANPIATRTDGLWTSDSSQSLAVRIYADNDSVDEYGCTITTPDATLETELVNEFDTTSLLPVHKNTIIVDDNDGGNDVELDMSEKLFTLVVDQSGSLTWNDSGGLRHDFSAGIVDVLEARYPSDIRFNLLEFKGEPCFSVFVPLTTRIDSNKISDVIKEHFVGDSWNFAGFRVVRRKDYYPTTAIDGEIVADGYALAALDVDLEQETDYFYKVFTYDHFDRFSEGVEIPVRTSSVSFPRGLANISGRVLRGYDLQLDENVVAMWNMDESENESVYDFGSSATTLFTADTRWLKKFDCPAGVGGLRFNGNSSKLQSATTADLAFEPTATMTVMMWVYLFDHASNVPFLVRGNNSNLNYALLIDSGVVKFGFNDSQLRACTSTIPIDAWTHVAVQIDGPDVAFYLNGEFVNTTFNATVPATTTTTLPINIGDDPRDVYTNSIFGKVSHVSIHNVARDASYIGAAANPSQYFDKNGNQYGLDNGDRLVVLDYVIPPDFDYTTVRIVRRVDSAPRFETDGETVLEETAVAGRYSFGSASLYDVDHIYYFRVFTRNSLGVWSPIEDSTLVAVSIPDIDRPPETYQDYLANEITIIPGPGRNTSLPIPTIIIQRAGNEKTWIKWADFTDDAVTRVKIYYSDEKFPVYDGKTKTIEGGALIFDGDIGVHDDFVHRKIPNKKTAFYAVVSCNRFQQFSNFAYVQLQPLENLDDSGIPLLEAINVQYHIIDYDRVKITWQSPVTISSYKESWFDEAFYIYAAICDLYGNPIPIDYPDDVKLTSSISETVINSVEDVFNQNIDVSGVEDLPKIAFNVNTSGLIVGVCRLRPNTLYSVIESISISCTAEYNYSDTFSYQFPSGTLKFRNPLEMQLLNRDALYLNTNDFVKDGCDVNDESGGSGKPKSATRRRVNGTYIRRKVPFAIRAQYTYKGLPISKAATSVKLFDAKDGPCAITPDLKKVSKLLLTTTNAFPTLQLTVPVLNIDGTLSGYTDVISFSDILVRPPQLPQSGSAYVRVSFNGFSIIRKIHMFYPTILKASLTAAAPKSDGIDVREQFSRFWLIDPDRPTDESKITLAPANTVVNWKMYQGTTIQRAVPFYSTDNVPLSNGVYSYTRSGTARNVYFGPAQPKAAGTYTLKVNATVSGLIAEVEAEIEIKGQGGTGGFEHFIPDPDAPRILCEFENCVNYLWADGVDYQKMTITRNPSDPTKSTTKYADKFRECSEVLFPLPIGTVINIDAKGYEIIVGDVTELTDDDGNPYIDTTNATTSLDSGEIKLTRENYSYVYFRKNEEVKPVGCHDIDTTSCVGFDLTDRVCSGRDDIGEETAVILSTKINYSGKPLTIYGGGSYTNDGRPPCVLVPKEPLQLDLIGIFNGTPLHISDTYLVDGVNTNTVYIEGRYAGQPLPANTEIKVDLYCNKTTINGVPVKLALGIPDYIYTVVTEEYPGDNDENNTGEYGIASLTVLPVPRDQSIRFALAFTATYPERPSLQTSSSSSGG